MRIAVAIAATLAALPSAGQDVDARVVKLLEQVSAERLQKTIEKLVSFETRNTLSNPEQPARGVGAARQWILDELKASSPRLQVGFDTYQVAGGQIQRIPKDVELRNVMAVLPGKSPRRLYVSGHYDTVVLRRGQAGAVAAPPEPGGAPQTFDPSTLENPAPGANDDGSGTALTIELARVFAQSGIEFDATLVFLCLAGEEQGLVGAKLHAQKAAAESWPIQAVLNNDIVGGSKGGNGVSDSGSVRVFSEGPEDSPSRALARYVQRQATLYVPSHRVGLVARHDRFGRGGDHTAFNQHGVAAVRISEAAENYTRQHSPLDLPEGVDFAYLTKNARVNAAALAGMALAPPPPVVVEERQGRIQPLLGRQPSGYDARLRWKPSPGAVGYRIFRRDSWTLDWQHEQSVGNVTEVVLKDVSIDDYVFGVAALSADGHESVVSAYVNPQRPSAEIKTR
jgi:hypothetical protein